MSGSTVAYSLDKKTFTIGKVLNVSRAEGKVTLHVYGPMSDGRLRIQWRPLFVENGAEQFHGTDPVKIVVEIGQVPMIAPLNDGVVQHTVVRLSLIHI